MAKSDGWEWWAGYADEVECEGSYTIGSYATREEAIAAGTAEMPDGEGNTHFMIIEAVLDPDGDPDVDEVIPFISSRNEETIHTGEASDA